MATMQMGKGLGQNMPPAPPHPCAPAWFIAAAFFILAMTYSLVTPLFESPDELWHYPFVWHLARTAQLPVQDPANPQLWQQEGSQPPLYYALAALLTAPVPADNLPQLIRPNPHADIGRVTADGNANIVVHTPAEAFPWRGAALAAHLARLFSVLLATGTVLAVYAIGRALWPQNCRFALLGMAFVAFNPMFIFLAGSVNNDNLITLLAALVLWRLVLLVSGQVDAAPGQFAVLGLLTGAAALAKVSGLGLLALTGLTLLGWGIRQRSWRLAVGYNALVGGIALLLAGWWYARNWQLYGDPTGTQIMVQLMGARPVPPSVGQLLSEIPGLLRSFWGLFGYFSVAMPAAVYWLLNGLLLAGGAGWLVIAGRRRPFPPHLRPTWPILLGWLAILLAGFVQWTLRTPATQGRLLFPALAAIAPLWAAGWLALSPRRLVWLPAALMLALAVWTPWGVIAPAYARPRPVTALPAEATPLPVTFGNTASLLGYRLPVDAVRPGQQLPVTLYWRGEQPTPTDYSLFLHLTDEQGLIIAQRDLFHGPGVFPTSQWPPGTQFADTYVLELPTTVYAPTQARLALGLYNHLDGARLPASTGGDSVTFGEVAVRPNPGPLPNPQQLRFEQGITLAGYELDRRQAAPGERINLTLHWQADAAPGGNYKVFVHLVGLDGSRAAQHDSEPQQGASPTGGWLPGQAISDVHPLDIAPDAAPGPYRLVVGLYHPDSGQRLPLRQNGDAWLQADSVTLAGVGVAE